MANILLINYVYYEGCTTAMVTPYLLVIYMCGGMHVQCLWFINKYAGFARWPSASGNDFPEP